MEIACTGTAKALPAFWVNVAMGAIASYFYGRGEERRGRVMSAAAKHEPSSNAALGIAGLAAIAATELALARVTGGPVALETAAAALGFALAFGAVIAVGVRFGVSRAGAVATVPCVYGGWLWVAPALERSDATAILVTWSAVGVLGFVAGWRNRTVPSVRAGLLVYALLGAAAWAEIALRTEGLPQTVIAASAASILALALLLGRYAVVLAVLALLPRLDSEVWTAESAPPALPDVLLISVDTLRFDAARQMTSFQQTAREGVLYSAQAPAPWTLPSLATLLTGLEPEAHGARRTPTGLTTLPRTATTLAESLSEMGYDTAASVQSPFANPLFGLRQGFARFRAEYVNPWVSPGTAFSDRARPLGGAIANTFGVSAESKRGAAARVADAQSLISARRERPLFLWLHFLDPHAPYLHAGSLDLPRSERQMLKRARRADLPARPKPEMLALLRNAYRNEVRVVDEAILAVLRDFAAGPHGRVVILTSDHGEEFGEHGRWEHGHTLHQELLAVPLAISGIPALAPADAGLVDVLPTLLAYLGGTQVPQLASAGRDLRRVDADAFYRSSNPLYGGLRRQVVKRGHLKLFKHDTRRAFFDLRTDPGEYHPRSSAGGEGEALVDLLSKLEFDSTPAVPLEAAARNALEALGYALPADERTPPATP